MISEINQLISKVHEDISEMRRKYKLIQRYERLNNLLNDLIELKKEYE